MWFDLAKVSANETTPTTASLSKIHSSQSAQNVLFIQVGPLLDYSLVLSSGTQRAPTTGTTHIFLLPTTHTQVHIRRREYHTIIFLCDDGFSTIHHSTTHAHFRTDFWSFGWPESPLFFANRCTGH